MSVYTCVCVCVCASGYNGVYVRHQCALIRRFTFKGSCDYDAISILLTFIRYSFVHFSLRHLLLLWRISTFGKYLTLLYIWGANGLNINPQSCTSISLSAKTFFCLAGAYVTIIFWVTQLMQQPVYSSRGYDIHRRLFIILVTMREIHLTIESICKMLFAEV